MDRGAISIRLTGPEDLPELARMRAHWMTGRPGDPDPQFVAAVAAWWSAENRVGWVARSDGFAVGMANAAIFTRMPKPTSPPQRWVYVANVWVEPERRREGIGGALMAAGLAWARAEGMVRVVLAPSEMSVPLYRSAGFRPAEDLMRLDFEPP